jgi:crotonobetainyl-CoA:carnitine CoA-transferase CaiB-like acyl-CoA transferase
VSARPLAGTIVLAAEQMHALPHATQLLALMGAEVIKVEPPGGESGRAGVPRIPEPDGTASGSTFVRNNLAKASVVLDLKADEGRQLFLDLARGVDVVAENFRPGTAARLGIGYEQVRAVHPTVVYASISGFGNQVDEPSPYQSWASYAPIVEAMSGLYEYSWVEGADGGHPQPAVAGALGDTVAGLYAAIGILAALTERARTGEGSYVDVAMFDAMVAVADVVHMHSVGVDVRRVLDGVGILHAFRAGDGWFVLEVVREPHFARLASAIGRPEWLDDPRLTTRTGWSEHIEDVIRPGIEAWARDRTPSGAAAELAAAGLAAGPVNRPDQVLADPHVTGRGLVHRYPGGPEGPDGLDGQAVAVVGNPIDLGGTPAPPPRWPTAGQHTDAVLRDRLGLDADALADLRRRGVVA